MTATELDRKLRRAWQIWRDKTETPTRGSICAVGDGVWANLEDKEATYYGAHLVHDPALKPGEIEFRDRE